MQLVSCTSISSLSAATIAAVQSLDSSAMRMRCMWDNADVMMSPRPLHLCLQAKPHMEKSEVVDNETGKEPAQRVSPPSYAL